MEEKQPPKYLLRIIAAIALIAIIAYMIGFAAILSGVIVFS